MKLLYKNKQIKMSNDSIVKMLMPSLISIGVCITCLLGTTFTWFNESVSISTQSIESATYGLDIRIKDNEDKELYRQTIMKDENFEYTLDTNLHKVYITAIGTSNMGYCKMIFEDGSILTYKINKGQTINLDEFYNKKCTFTAIWGTSLNNNKFENSDIVGTSVSEHYLEEVNNNKVNNNLETPKEEGVEQNTSQSGEIESITPSEGEPEVEEDNEITESDNSDIILDTTETPSQESQNYTIKEYNTIN